MDMERSRFLYELPVLTFGTFLVSVGIYFFKFPNHFTTGGVAGLSILLAEVIPPGFMTAATLNTVISILFLLLGFVVLDKGFGVKTIYCSLLSSGLIQLFDYACPLSKPLTDQPLLELFFAVILPAFGSAILFNHSASTGGSDIVAMILKKYTGLDVGRALLISDAVVALGAFFLFDVKTGLFSFLGLTLKSELVDSVIESLNRKKSFTVIVQDPAPVCDYIIHTLHRGATVWKAEGAYTRQEHFMVLTALSRHQAMMLRNFLRENAPGAFMLITNSSEIFGKGFLNT